MSEHKNRMALPAFRGRVRCSSRCSSWQSHRLRVGWWAREGRDQHQIEQRQSECREIRRQRKAAQKGKEKVSGW